MPRSRTRRRAPYTPPPGPSPVKLGSPRWLAPTMVACFVLGLAWIIVYYVSATAYPIPGIRAWNLAIGFGWVLAGFGLATRWS